MSPQSADPWSLFHVKPDWTEPWKRGFRLVLSAEEVRIVLSHMPRREEGAFSRAAAAILERGW